MQWCRFLVLVFLYEKQQFTGCVVTVLLLLCAMYIQDFHLTSYPIIFIGQKLNVFLYTLTPHGWLEDIYLLLQLQGLLSCVFHPMLCSEGSK